MSSSWKSIPSSIALSALLAFPIAAIAQNPATAVSAAEAKSKTPAFEVISIRQNQETNAGGPPIYGPTENGFRSIRQPFVMVLMAAYPPQNTAQGAFFMRDSVSGVPDWMLKERYDLEARVGETDLARWKDPAEQPVLVRAMLQNMMEDRLKLTVHREMTEKPVFELQVGKNTSKLTPSAGKDLTGVREQHPRAGQLPGGMIIVEGEGGLGLYSATMASLGSLLSQVMHRPIVDKTELTGTYDLNIKLDNTPGPDGNAPDRETALITALQDQLGLKLVAAKRQVETLVVDHAEKPTEN